MKIKSQRDLNNLAFKYAASEMRNQDFTNFFADDTYADDPKDQVILEERLEKAQKKVVDYLLRRCKP